MKGPAHLALNPFGQIPTYEAGDLALFETGSIALHIAERHAGLVPDDAYLAVMRPNPGPYRRRGCAKRQRQPVRSRSNTGNRIEWGRAASYPPMPATSPRKLMSPRSVVSAKLRPRWIVGASKRKGNPWGA